MVQVVFNTHHAASSPGGLPSTTYATTSAATNALIFRRGGLLWVLESTKVPRLLILLKLTLVSEEGVYCYVNGRVFTQSADHSDLFLPSRDTDREAPLLFAH